jgi:hypothetical protein
VVLALLGFGPTLVLAQGNGKGGKGGGKGACRGGSPITDPIPITATFRDLLDGDSPDRIQSDGNGSYGPSDGLAKINCGGEIQIADWENVGRKIFLDFRDPASEAPCDPCLRTYNTTYSTPFSFNTNVLADPGDPTEDDGTLVGGAYNIPVGESRWSRLKLNFSHPDGDLTIRFKPSEFPDTEPVLVTRESLTMWVVEAFPEDIAKLMTPNFHASTGTKGKGKNKGHDEGNYRMPFRLVAVSQ